MSGVLALRIVHEEVKKGKRDQNRHIGMQTYEKKISLWENFVLDAITSMYAPGRDLGPQEMPVCSDPRMLSFLAQLARQRRKSRRK